jgi:SpoVK/Ycf46/Vps4 family AAA+-type ATPase
MLDPALLRPGRLGDLIMDIPRPNQKAGAEILSKYLTPKLPYGCQEDGSVSCDDVLEAATAKIYAPNGGSALAKLTFRDGKERVVHARDLINGAVLSQIAHAATERAFVRETESGEEGIRIQDLFGAIDDAFESSVRALTPMNCRRHIDDLPTDVDVIKVERLKRRVERPHRYIRVA